MSAVKARNGQIKWQAGSQGLSFSRTGEFYSTPAVAFGRVYSGNNDGRVYSFDAKTGELAWTQSTGGYVYPGPAVADTPRMPPDRLHRLLRRQHLRPRRQDRGRALVPIAGRAR